MNLKEYPRLAAEWDFEKNESIAPEAISDTSHKRIWWRCGRGHSWNTELKDRTRKPSGCPYCAGRLPIPGKTDLVTIAPELVKEWNPTRNGEKKPEQYTAGSQQKVWWQCGLGHEWQAVIENRAIKGSRCPFCTGKKAWPGYNDFVTLCPELVKELHPTLNKGIDLSRLRPGAHKRVYWICSEGHVWDTWLDSRTSKKHPGCPVCARNVKKSAKAAQVDDAVRIAAQSLGRIGERRGAYG